MHKCRVSAIELIVNYKGLSTVAIGSISKGIVHLLYVYGSEHLCDPLKTGELIPAFLLTVV
eukprot:5102941-Amphidinium_carterae.1